MGNLVVLLTSKTNKLGDCNLSGMCMLSLNTPPSNGDPSGPFISAFKFSRLSPSNHKRTKGGGSRYYWSEFIDV